MNEFDGMTNDIVAAAIAVHRELGPGLLESAYSACLAAELAATGIPYASEVAIPITYRDVNLACISRRLRSERLGNR